MHKLKEYRDYHRLSLDEIARKINIEQRTLEQWESGKKSPDLPAVRELSIIYDTTIDELLGKPHPIHAMSITRRLKAFDGGDGYFFGYVAVRLPGQTRFFPITSHENKLIIKLLASCDDEIKKLKWLSIYTLNNRILLISKEHINLIATMDEGCLPTPVDWIGDWDGNYGHPLEIYKTIQEMRDGYSLNDQPHSKTLEQRINNITSHPKYTEEEIFEQVVKTAVYFKDGTTLQLMADYDCLKDIVFECEFNETKYFILKDFNLCTTHLLNTNQVTMISIPQHQYIESVENESNQKSINGK